MLCTWEGNRRSGIALAIYDRHCGLSTNGLSGLVREMSMRHILRYCLGHFILPYTIRVVVIACIQ